MKQKEASKKSFFDRLPKFSKASVLILMVGIFLIILLALMLLLNKQKDEFPNLQQEATNLQKIATASIVNVGEIESRISNAESSISSIKKQFPVETESNRVIDDLMKLADDNGIEITAVSVARSEQKINTSGGEQKYSALSYTLNLSGEASRMQTYIYELRKVGACRISSVNIKPSGSETVMDTGIVKLDMFLRK